MDRHGERNWKGNAADLPAVLQGSDLSEVLQESQSTALAQAEDSLVMNHVVLTGLIAVDPQDDQSPDGKPITTLLVAFVAPDEKVDGATLCEVEVPNDVADGHRQKLCAGAAILISGKLTGAGGLRADIIVVGRAS